MTARKELAVRRRPMWATQDTFYRQPAQALNWWPIESRLRRPIYQQVLISVRSRLYDQMWQL